MFAPLARSEGVSAQVSTAVWLLPLPGLRRLYFITHGHT